MLDKILVVDDSVNNLDILVELLDEYDVIDTTSGVDAIDILKDEKVSLILLDIMMPDMSGFDVCKILKSNPTTKDIPVMFITSKTDEESIEEAYEIGGIDYITKPFKAKELLAKVHRELKLQSLIDELKNSKREMEHLASVDHLTGLYNRRYFLDRAECIFKNAFELSKELSVFMLDIDKFKSVNDTYGHQMGDDVLVMVSNILKNSIRELDILSRFGGEEFIVLLPQTSQEQAKQIAQNVRENIENHELYLKNGEILKITASIGVSEIDKKHDTQIDEMIARADKALYEAKNSGRNRVCIK